MTRPSPTDFPNASEMRYESEGGEQGREIRGRSKGCNIIGCICLHFCLMEFVTQAEMRQMI